VVFAVYCSSHTFYRDGAAAKFNTTYHGNAMSLCIITGALLLYPLQTIIFQVEIWRCPM
jgi:hypothetical protein